jgi:hypothetical protein
VGAQGVSEFYAHVAESAETGDAGLFALGDSPVVHRRVSGNAGAEQRSDPGGVKVCGNPEDELLVDDKAVRITTVGHAAGVLAGKIVSEGEIRAELFEGLLALEQTPQESTIQPTEARSPVLNLVTADPIWVTRPRISWPGTHG